MAESSPSGRLRTSISRLEMLASSSPPRRRVDNMGMTHIAEDAMNRLASVTSKMRESRAYAEAISNEERARHVTELQYTVAESDRLREELRLTKAELAGANNELARTQRGAGMELQDTKRSQLLTEERLAEANRDAQRFSQRIEHLERISLERESEMDKICAELLASERGLEEATRQAGALRTERDAVR
jgi:hypothetical protein